jgi:eukaryotic-like serine/threonine-protein kinase
MNIEEIPEAEVCASARALEEKINFDHYSLKGNNSFVLFGANRITGTKVAVKYYYWGGVDERHIEPRELSGLKSDNIIPILDASIAGQWAYFMTPFLELGDLDEFVARGPLGSRDALRLVQGLVNGVSHLHAADLVHRDLKPANLFLSDTRELLIGDFGSVRRLAAGATTAPASGHSVLYRPPESFDGEYGKVGDIYQIGVVLYQLCGGRLSYEDQSWLNPQQRKAYKHAVDDFECSQIVDAAIAQRVRTAKLLDLSTLNPWIPERVKRTIRKATQPDLARRYATTAELVAELHAIRDAAPDWGLEDGVLVLTPIAGPKRRVIPYRGTFVAEKWSRLGWRSDKLLCSGTMADMIKRIEKA